MMAKIRFCSGGGGGCGGGGGGDDGGCEAMLTYWSCFLLQLFPFLSYAAIQVLSLILGHRGRMANEFVAAVRRPNFGYHVALNAAIGLYS